MNALIPFAQSIEEAEQAIENAHADAHSVKHALTHGCGLLEGYYRAGSVSRFDFEHGCRHLRHIADQRTAMQQLRDEAIRQGLAGACP